ncbi:pentatricopeptide repeat-containing protein At2g22410, mitochondrial-like [Andrographis paniculata]|uniref:pentatricopeptide repeat-containing protein At2g22410, mitochondrial-like n=1 Tax=Andrographis paniculata TaxID=175694 RepID=UPI0021E71034|nr:pentatricopeptide repeat-containing protein At2g22410, mitochondrial-like [Andrographis paniculata]
MSGRPLSELRRSVTRHRAAAVNTAARDPISNYRIKELHGRLIRSHQCSNSNSMAEVIKHYALSESSLQKSMLAFSKICNPSLPIWNHMIRGLSQSDRPEDALHLFDEMRQRGLRGNNLTFIFVCKACAKIPNILYGKRIHVHVLKMGFGSYLYACNALIHMYGFCGELGFARKVFDEMSERDLVSWNSLICSYSQCGNYDDVLGVFDAMRVENVKADAVTMVKVVLACVHVGETKLVESMMEYIEDNGVEIDVFLGNTLIDVYGKRGSVGSAWNIFERMGKKNVVSWNAMIAAAAKSGDISLAKKLFDETVERDVVTWTCMIAGYAQSNRYEDAVTLFDEMVAAKINPDRVTIATVLSACARLGRLDLGDAVHDYLTRSKIETDIYVENALVDMYSKCGSVEKALAVFRGMKRLDPVSWTAIICGVAVNGDPDRALNLFSEMLRNGVKPIHGTFVGVLLACAHSGLVEKGLSFFDDMRKIYGLVPEMAHYGCVVDLLCRAGDLCKAYEVARSIPVSSDVVVWRMLLSACNLYGDTVLAKIASDKILEVDPCNGVDYVLSSNLYAGVEKWDEVVRMRELVEKGRGNVSRPSGWSSIQIID